MEIATIKRKIREYEAQMNRTKDGAQMRRIADRLVVLNRMLREEKAKTTKRK